MNADPSKRDFSLPAKRHSFGKEIDEFRDRLARQRAGRAERVALLNERAKAPGAPSKRVEDRPLLISGTPID
jgi:hypothetical protein